MNWLLRLFGIKPTVPAPTTHKDPVAEYLDGQISAEEMDRRLDRKIYGMPDVVGEEWR